MQYIVSEEGDESSRKAVGEVEAEIKYIQIVKFEVCETNTD